MIRYKIKINYTAYTIVAFKFLNQTVDTFNEWGVNALVTQESFAYLKKNQSTPRAEGVGCTILDNIDFLTIHYSYISIKKSI